LQEQIKITKVDKKLVLAEFLLMSHDHQKSGKHAPEYIKPFNVASAIHDHIEFLANKDALCKCEMHINPTSHKFLNPFPTLMNFLMTLLLKSI